jgi:hypothetical protein
MAKSNFRLWIAASIPRSSYDGRSSVIDRPHHLIKADEPIKALFGAVSRAHRTSAHAPSDFGQDRSWSDEFSETPTSIGQSFSGLPKELKFQSFSLNTRR